MPIAWSNREGQIQFWSPRAEELFGYTAEELPTVRDWLRLAFPEPAYRAEAQESWERAVAVAARTGSDISMPEARISCKNGAIRHVKIIAAWAGELMTVLFNDVTDRRLAEDALRENEERLSAALAGIPAAIAISEYATSRYVLVNPGFEQITGYSAAEAIGKTSGDLNLWLDRGERSAVIDALLAHGHLDDFEAKFRRRDGSTITGMVSGNVITSGGRKYLLTVTRDITKQRELEKRYQEAQRLEGIGRLAGGIAHDFNNLLTCVIGAQEAALMNLAEDHPARRLMVETIELGQRAAGLTQQLLAFSRRQMLAPKLLNLNEVIVDTSRTLRRLLGNEIELRLQLAPKLDAISADPVQIQQVLMNLSVNARDAMPNGGQLTLETAHAEHEASSWVLLRVSDSGEGMSKETRERIFEPFFTTKEQGRGTGLGLATVYGIVQQSAGQITVRSELGQGTSFELLLPRRGASATLSPRRATVQGFETILAVDDDAAIRRLVGRILGDAGYRVIVAGSAEQALQLAAAHADAIDVLLTDLILPATNGHQLAEQLCRVRPRLRVLYMSGHSDDDLARQAIRADDVLFLPKPFTADQLTHKLRELIER